MTIALRNRPNNKSRRTFIRPYNYKDARKGWRANIFYVFVKKVRISIVFLMSACYSGEVDKYTIASQQEHDAFLKEHGIETDKALDKGYYRKHTSFETLFLHQAPPAQDAPSSSQMAHLLLDALSLNEEERFYLTQLTQGFLVKEIKALYQLTDYAWKCLIKGIRRKNNALYNGLWEVYYQEIRRGKHSKPKQK